MVVSWGSVGFAGELASGRFEIYLCFVIPNLLSAHANLEKITPTVFLFNSAAGFVFPK